MPHSYDVLTLPALDDAAGILADEVLSGLSSTPKQLSSKWLYDARGSRLFEAIIETNEYYLTRCEAEVLTRNRMRIAELAGKDGLRLIELGVGDGRKTRPILSALLQRDVDFTYVPVDICEATIAGLTQQLQTEFGESLSVRGMVAEYMDAVEQLAEETPHPSLVMFLGSNIGNFNISESVEFLRSLRNGLNAGDRTLIGFDLKKPIDILEAAYNDTDGVTAEFNYNLLDRLNRELGADFDRTQFVHHGRFNVRYGRMESWLVSKKAQAVSVRSLKRDFYFEPWEGIHVENSQKYGIADIEAIAEEAGFEIVEHLFDNRRFFCDSIWSAI